MIGIYFSGTGNTRFCTETFLKYVGEGMESCSIEDGDIASKIKRHQEIVFAYPVYYSNLPKIVRDFIMKKGSLFKGKKIFLIATMGLFSGDGTGCGDRIFKKFGAETIGGLQLKMPDCIGDEKLLKKSLEQNRALIKAAEAKIEKAVGDFKAGNPPKEGLGIWYHMAGLFGQRLWFYNKTKKYSEKLHIDRDKCVGCGKCATFCPMKNISMDPKKAISHKKCTMCYRCVSHCPAQAITLLGTKVYEQCRIEKYL